MNELKSYTEYAVSTPTADFVIGFDFNYGEDAVNVTVNDVPAAEAGYTVVYLNETTMRLSPSVPSGVVRLQRETDIDQSDHAYRAGAKFIAQTMDENFEQLRHSQQEVRDGFSKLSDDTYEIIDTLQEVGQSAQDAADAAEVAAGLANDAAAQVNDKVSYEDFNSKPHNAMLDRDAASAHPTRSILDASGATQQDINDFGGAKRRNKSGGYALHARVVLENGDIVKSIIDGNTNDPNVDMTGWVKDNSASQIIDKSGKTQQEINDNQGELNSKFKNRIVYFEDFVSDVTGTTDVTAEMQSLLDSHDGDIYAKQTSIFRTTKTLFNRKHNRTIDFHNAKIINKSNSRYAIVTISPSFVGSLDSELNTFMTERHYGEEVINSHIINIHYEMSANSSGGANLGVGIVYGDRCKLSRLFPKSTNGNGLEIRNSIQCLLYRSDLRNFRNYSSFIFMSKKCEIFGNKFSGGVDGLIMKMNRDGDPDCAHRVAFNIFEDAGLAGNAIGGGVVREKVLTHEIYVSGHEWVDNVKIHDNTFICKTTVQKIAPSIYARNWKIYNNTFKCGGLAGTLFQVGGLGVPDAGETLLGGHKIYDNEIYDLDSPANAMVDARLNCSFYNNKLFNVKSMYMIYARDTLSGAKTDSVGFYDNEFYAGCGIYCNSAGAHGFSATTGNKNFRFTGNKGELTALVRGASVNLTALYSLAENTDTDGNELTLKSSSGINSITGQLFGTTKLKRLGNQKITIDATIPLTTAIAVQTSATTEVLNRHEGNEYILVGSATTARAFVSNSDMLDGINTFLGSWNTKVYNNFNKPVTLFNIDRQSTVIPNSGTYTKGDFVRNVNPSIVANTITFGWLRITSGSTHVLNTDWVEIKQSTT